jgi:hypothetical protein
MTSSRRAVLILSLTLVSSLAWARPEPPTKAARAAFDAYVDALATKNGPAAVKLVTAGTLDYYEKMRVAALQAPAKVVKEMGLTDQIMVVVLRVQMKPEELRALNGEKLFVEAVKRGWIDSSMIAHADLGKLAVRGDVGSGRLTKDGQDLGFDWTLERQGGVWKNDLVHAVQFINVVMKQQLKAAGIDQNQLVLTSAEALAGHKLSASIWDPPPASK